MNEEYLKNVYDQLAAGDNVSGSYADFLGKVQKDNGKALYGFMQELEPSDVKYEDFAAQLSVKKKDGTTPSEGSFSSQPPAQTAGTPIDTKAIARDSRNSWSMAAYTGEKSLLKKLSSPSALPVAENSNFPVPEWATNPSKEYKPAGIDWSQDPSVAGENHRKFADVDYEARKKVQGMTELRVANREKENLNLYWDELTYAAAAASHSLEKNFGEDWEQKLASLGEEADRASKVTEADIAVYRKNHTAEETKAWYNVQSGIIDTYNSMVKHPAMQDLMGVEAAKKKVVDARRGMPEKYPILKIADKYQQEADARYRKYKNGVGNMGVGEEGFLEELASQTARVITRAGAGIQSAIGNIPDAYGSFEGDIAVPKAMKDFFRGISDYADQAKEYDALVNPKPTPLNRQSYESVVGFEGLNVVVKRGKVQSVRDDDGFEVKVDDKFADRFKADGGVDRAEKGETSFQGGGNLVSNMTQMAADFGGMLIGQRLGGTPGMIASSYALIQQDLFTEAMNDMNMTRAEAAQYAAASAGIQSAIESFISPAKVLEGGAVAIDAVQAAFKLGRREAVAAMGRVATKDLPFVFVAPAAKLGFQIAGENLEEAGQAFSDVVIREGFNRETGSRLKAEHWTREDMQDSFLMTTLLTGTMGVAGMGGGSTRYAQNALVKAARSPELFNDLVDQYAEKGGISFDEATKQKAMVAQLSKDLSSFPAQMGDDDVRLAVSAQRASLQTQAEIDKDIAKGTSEAVIAVKKAQKKVYDDMVKKAVEKYVPVVSERPVAPKTDSEAAPVEVAPAEEAVATEANVAGPENAPSEAQTIEYQSVVTAPQQAQIVPVATEVAPKEEEIDPFAHLDGGLEMLLPEEMRAGTNPVVYENTENDLSSNNKTVFAVSERFKEDPASAGDAVVNTGLNIAKQSGVEVGEKDLPGFADFVTQHFADEDLTREFGARAASDHIAGLVREWDLHRKLADRGKMTMSERFDPETFMDRVASFFNSGGRITPTTFGQHGDPNLVKGEKSAQLNYFSNKGKALDLLIHDGTLGQLENGMDEKDAIQQVVDFIASNLKGPADYMWSRIDEQEAEAFKAVRGEVMSAEEEFALGQMKPEEAEQMQNKALASSSAITNEWSQNDESAFEDFINNFINESGQVDNDAVLASVNGFDPLFLELPQNVQDQITAHLGTNTDGAKTESAPQAEKGGEVREGERGRPTDEADVVDQEEEKVLPRTVNDDMVLDMNAVGLLSDAEAEDVIDYLRGDKSKEEAFEAANAKIPELEGRTEPVGGIIEAAKANDPLSRGMTAPLVMEREGGSLVIGAEVHRDAILEMGGKWDKQFQGYFVPGKNKIEVLAAMAGERTERAEVTRQAPSSLEKIFSFLGAAREAVRVQKMLAGHETVKQKIQALEDDRATREFFGSKGKWGRLIMQLAKAFPNVNIVIDPARFRAELIKRGHSEEEIASASGFQVGNEVFLNPDLARMDTQIHEFGHIWNAWLKNNDMERFNAGLELMKGSEYEAAVRADPRYSNLSEEDVLEEALALAIGERGARIFEKTSFEKFSDWLKDMWSAVQRAFGRKVEGDTMREFVDRTARRMLSGDAMVNEVSARVTELEDQVKFNFVGAKAKVDESVKSDLLFAKELEGQLPADRVWRITGWFKGVDGQWRYEHPATDMKLKAKLQDGDAGLLGDILDAGVLQLYPELSRLPYSVGLESGVAALDLDSDGFPVSLSVAAGSEKAMTSAISHEIQHYIQQKEGFAMGSPSDKAGMQMQLVNQLDNFYETGVLLESDGSKGFEVAKPYYEALTGQRFDRAYYQSSGEVEARLVEKRTLLEEERGFGVFPSQPVGIYDKHFVSPRGLVGLREFDTYEEAMVAKEEGEVVAKLADRKSVMPLLMMDVAPEEQLVFGMGLRNALAESFVPDMEERNVDIPSDVKFHFLSSAVMASQKELAARAIIQSEVKKKRITPAAAAVKQISDAFGYSDLEIGKMWSEEAARERSIQNRFFVAAGAVQTPFRVVWEKVVERFFYNNGLLPSEIYMRAKQASFSKAGTLRELASELYRLEKAAKKEMGSYNADVRKVIDSFMKGEIDLDFPETKHSAFKLRGLIDRLSLDFVRESGMKGEINVTILENAGVQLYFMPDELNPDDLALNILQVYGATQQKKDLFSKMDVKAIAAYNAFLVLTPAEKKLALEGMNEADKAQTMLLELSSRDTMLSEMDANMRGLFEAFELNAGSNYVKSIEDDLAAGNMIDMVEFDKAVAKSIEVWGKLSDTTSRVLKILEKNPYDRTRLETYILNKYISDNKTKFGTYQYRSYEMNDDADYITHLKSTPEGMRAWLDGVAHLKEVAQKEIDELKSTKNDVIVDLEKDLQKATADIQASLDRAKAQLDAAKPYTPKYAEIKKALESATDYALLPINEYLKKQDMGKAALADLSGSVRRIIDLRLKRNEIEQRIVKRQNWSQVRMDQLERDKAEAANRLSTMLQHDTVSMNQSGMLGAKDVGALKKRKDLSEAARLVMGQYNDVNVNVTRTVSKLTSMLASQRLLNDLRDRYAYIHFFPDGQQKGDYNKQVAAQSSSAMNPLNGWWTTKDIYEEMKDWEAADMGSNSIEGQVFDHITDFLKLTMSKLKYGATIWSPMTHGRNFFGNTVIVAANGNLFTGNGKMAAQVFLDIFHLSQNEEKLNELAALGIIQGAAGIGDLKAGLQGRAASLLEKGDAKARELDRELAGGWVFEKPEKFYAAEDDFWRIYSFYAEMKAYSKARYGKKLSELDKKQYDALAPRVATIISNTMPTYAMAARYVKLFKYLPVGPSFVHFPAEMYRVSKNTILLGLEEISDPQTRGIGFKRLASFAVTNGMMSIFVEYALSALRGDDEKEDWLEYFCKPWQKNTTKAHTKAEPPVYDKEHTLVSGGYEMVSVSQTDAYSFFKRPINLMLTKTDKGGLEKTKDILMTAGLNSFWNEGLLTYVIDVGQNEAGGNRGKEVYHESVSAIDNAEEITDYLAKNLAPGWWKLGERIGLATGVFKNETGFPVRSGAQIALSIVPGITLEKIDPYLSARALFKNEQIPLLADCDELMRKQIYRFTEAAGKEKKGGGFNFIEPDSAEKREEYLAILEDVREEYKRSSANFQRHMDHSQVLVDGMRGLLVPEPEVEHALQAHTANGQQLSKERREALLENKEIEFDVKDLDFVKKQYRKLTGMDF